MTTAIVYPLLRCEIGAELEDELPELLHGLPVRGSEARPAAPGRTSLLVYLVDDRPETVAEVRRALASAGIEGLALELVAAEDWLDSYRRQTLPFPVGRLWWMDPHPDAPTPAPEGRIRLAVEPRMAFGTGSHESTQMVLLELEELVVEGRRVLDVGSGSGILSLAASARGAARVVGFDVDPQAVWVARQIALQQEWPARVSFFIGGVAAVAGARFDLVLCNMIVDQVVPLLPQLRAALSGDGMAVLSGILDAQRELIRSELAAVGLTVTGERRLGEWLGLRVVAA